MKGRKVVEYSIGQCSVSSLSYYPVIDTIQKGWNNSNDESTLLLVWDDSIQVFDHKLHHHSNSGVSLILDKFQKTEYESNACTSWYVMDNEYKDKDTLARECPYCQSGHSKDEASGHHHVWIQHQIPRSNVALQQNNKLLVFPQPNILPLQSLQISLVSSNQQGQEETNKSLSTRLLLLQAFWKRQLVGKMIWYDRQEEETTTRLRLLTPLQRQSLNSSSLPTTTYYAIVESVIPIMSPSRNTTTASWFCNFFAILPSTRITIVPTKKKNSDAAKGAAKPLPTSPLSTNPPSEAAKILLETLQHVMHEREHIHNHNNVDIPRTFLLSGGPGTGKTYSVQWAYQQAQQQSSRPVKLCVLIGSELLLQHGGSKNGINISSPAQALRHFFETACCGKNNNNSKKTSAVLIFLDECDALVSVESVAAMLANLLDMVQQTSSSSLWKHVLVVGATNRIQTIPDYLRRPGRFDKELILAPPTAHQRAALLKSILMEGLPRCIVPGLCVRDDNDDDDPMVLGMSQNELLRFAELCVGYVPADLVALVRKAWLLSLQDRVVKKQTKENDFIDSTFATNRILYYLEKAREDVGSSALRDASLSAPPKITWDDVAGDPGGAKTALRQAIEWPRIKAREFALLGLQPPRGILLHGPPGCAKTTLARAAAGASGVAFLSLSPAQVYASSYVGEAELVIRRAFTLARSAAPCILFFDEIDSIFAGSSNSSGAGDHSSGMGGSRGGSGRGGSAEGRVLSTFLNEMDGVDISSTGKDGVLVLGATNRPWTLDAALLRPGRLGDKIIYLPPPDAPARQAIFEMQVGSILMKTTKEPKFWDWQRLVEMSDGMTGAEIVGACQEAKIRWLKDYYIVSVDAAKQCNDNDLPVRDLYELFLRVLGDIKPLFSDHKALEQFRIFGR